MRKISISDNALHAALAVAIVHLLTTVSILLHVKGHWGWYASLVLTVWVLVLIGSVLCARADASTYAAKLAAKRPGADPRDLPARYR